MTALLLALMFVSSRPIHITGGQSLAIGVLGGGNSNAGGQVGDNLMCASGRRGIDTLTWDVISPASETSPAISSNIPACNPWPSVCITNYDEPPGIGFVNHYRVLTGRDSYWAAMGRDASAYVPWMQPSSRPFQYLNLQVAAYGAKPSPGEGYCSTLYIIHGEADHIASTSASAYESYLVDWRNNVQALCDAVASQHGHTVVAVFDQVSSYTDTSMGSSTSSNIDMAQYAAAKHNPSTHFLSGAKYISPGGYGGPHGYATAYRYWGKMAAKARVAVEQSGRWSPVWPLAYARSGANVVVTYNVPVPPLVLGTGCNGDGITVTAPADGNFGFSYSTSAISSVALCTDTDTPITGCFAPATCTGPGSPVTGCERAGQSVAGVSYVLTTPGSGVARYASVGTAGAAPGQATGVRGMLCDSDTAIADGYRMRNWGVQTGLASLDTVP